MCFSSGLNFWGYIAISLGFILSIIALVCVIKKVKRPILKLLIVLGLVIVFTLLNIMIWEYAHARLVTLECYNDVIDVNLPY